MPDSKVRTIQYLRDFTEITSVLDILDKRGQGTFASVFTVQAKDEIESNRQTYALKILIPTVDVKRIENEVRILRRLGGRCNVIRMHTAWRVRDHVFILMPYINYIPFTEYYLTADEAEIVRYLRSLLIAVSYIHKYHIIHRDIKPTNFLMDQQTRRFYLVDFGLAHSETYGDIDDRWELDCTVHDESVKQKQLSKRSAVRSTEEVIQQPHKKMRIDQSPEQDKSKTHMPGILFKPTFSMGRVSPTISASPAWMKPNFSHLSTTPISAQNTISGTCVCGIRLTVCRGCRQLPRLTAARRGGTLGFRPPEVMVRHVEQTTAVDVWAVGVILLSFLSGRYPFIRVEDDLDVLHAFTHLLGYERMCSAMKSLGRCLLLDPKPPAMSSVETPASWLKARCVAIRHNEKKLFGLPPLLSKSIDKENSAPTNEDSTQKTIALPASHIFPESAYDLAVRLLEPNPQKRISATDVLRHPFLQKDKTVLPTNSRVIAHRTEQTKAKNRESTESTPFQVRAQFC